MPMSEFEPAIDHFGQYRPSKVITYLLLLRSFVG